MLNIRRLGYYTDNRAKIQLMGKIENDYLEQKWVICGGILSNKGKDKQERQILHN